MTGAGAAGGARPGFFSGGWGAMDNRCPTDDEMRRFVASDPRVTKKYDWMYAHCGGCPTCKARQDAEWDEWEHRQSRTAFWQAYDRLSRRGACDSPGGMEYRRVKREWVRAGKPRPIARFIRGHAV